MYSFRRADRSRYPAERRRGAAADAADGAAPAGCAACRERQAAAADPAPDAPPVRPPVRAVEPGPAAVRPGGVGASHRRQPGRTGDGDGHGRASASLAPSRPAATTVRYPPTCRATRWWSTSEVAIAPAAVTPCIRSASCAPSNSTSPRRSCGSGSPGGRVTRAAAARTSCRWRRRQTARWMAAYLHWHSTCYAGGTLASSADGGAGRARGGQQICGCLAALPPGADAGASRHQAGSLDLGELGGSRLLVADAALRPGGQHGADLGQGVCRRHHAAGARSRPRTDQDGAAGKPSSPPQKSNWPPEPATAPNSGPAPPSP